ncbi:hypothetical protein ACR77J_12020 [Tissierella praeacuta]|uniref:hypothetical protein n=1 Tax=Tissierella praeacuta TaxID=43131 RepID=UPI001051F813|nr:hypothetical protein [Tissierella praeacuta]TCU72852.1 hypothetical protein EV204_105188 [Tissierella praeacuta]
MLEKAIAIDEVSMGANLGFMDKANWKPKWQIEKYDKDMNLYETEEIDGNLLLNEGITSLLTLLIGGSETSFNNANAHIGVGDGTTAANASQTGLIGVNKTYKPMDSTYPKVEGQTVVFRSTFGPDDGNHAWREFTVANGLSDSAKNLNRKVESALRTKANPDTWVIQLQVTIS